MRLATGQAFPPSQGQHQLLMNSFSGTTSAAKSTARGNASGNWTSFSPFSIFKSETTPAAKAQPQAMPLASGQYQQSNPHQLDNHFSPPNFQIKSTGNLTSNNNTLCQGMSSGFRPAFLISISE